MDFFVGGYFLVQGFHSKGIKALQMMPDIFWTCSRCFCDIYPDPTDFDPHSTHHKEMIKKLNLNQEEFKTLNSRVTDMLDKNELEWPNIFLDISAARQFYSKYLNHLPEIKLLSFALSEPYLSEYLEENKHKTGNNGCGAYTLLQRRQLVDPTAIIRGFEILGEEYGGGFHTFFCNNLQKAYVKKLGLTLNTNGLLDNYEDAIEAFNYTILDEVGAEPVYWLPWLVLEHSLI